MSTILPAIPTERLFRHDATHYSIDASEATFGGQRALFGQAYNDSCDEGLSLISERTGHSLKMVLARTHRNADNDITHWELYSCPHDVRRLKMAAPLKLTIWNT